MSMNYRKSIVMFVIAFLVQTSLLNVIMIKGYTPNLLLCLVVTLSFLYEDETYGIVLGAIFGVLYDICFSTVVGPTALCLVVVAAFILLVRELVNIENIINMWVVATISIAVYYVLNWLLIHLTGNPLGILYMLAKLPGEYIYSIIIITILYLILLRLSDRHRRDKHFR